MIYLFGNFFMFILCRSQQCRAVLSGGSARNCGNSGCPSLPPHLNSRGLNPSHTIPFAFLNPNPVNSLQGSPSGASALIPSGPPLGDPNTSSLRICDPQHTSCPSVSTPVNISISPLITSRQSLPYYTRGGHKFLRTRARTRGMSMGQKVSGKFKRSLKFVCNQH